MVLRVCDMAEILTVMLHDKAVGRCVCSAGARCFVCQKEKEIKRKNLYMLQRIRVSDSFRPFVPLVAVAVKYRYTCFP